MNIRTGQYERDNGGTCWSGVRRESEGRGLNGQANGQMGQQGLFASHWDPKLDTEGSGLIV